VTSYRRGEARRSEADWEQFSADQREECDRLREERDGYQRAFEAELHVSRSLREYLSRLETEVQRLKNIVESLPDGGLKDWNVT
jgi:2-polyprenyl-6-methoxyphenol hydroxylase-like FAD-dependent oxidoreductase